MSQIGFVVNHVEHVLSQACKVTLETSPAIHYKLLLLGLFPIE